MYQETRLKTIIFLKRATVMEDVCFGIRRELIRDGHGKGGIDKVTYFVRAEKEGSRDLHKFIGL